jgi:hypothetical protein
MRSIAGHILVVFIALAPGCLAQHWEIGGAGGYGFPRDQTVTNAGGSAKAGFKPNAAVSAIAGQNLYRRLSGEMRYTYRFGDLKVSGGGEEATFAAQTHAIHYDLLFHAAPREARIRPFVAGGGGIKFFRGTGKERAYQPLNKFALLTKTQEVEGLISVGGGVKVSVSDRVRVRLEFRDYITQFPKEVIAPALGAKLSGWLHDFVPMVGITFGF